MKIHKGVQAVGLFIGLYILLQIALFLIGFFFHNQIVDGFSSIYHGADTWKIVFLLFLQSLLFFLFLYSSFVWWNKQTDKKKNIYLYFKKRWQWKGWRLAGKYVVGGLGIYFLFNIIVGGLIQYYHLDIPGFYGKQVVMIFFQGLEVHIWWVKFIFFFLVTFFAPLVEEMIWRGFVTDRLMKSRQGEGVFLASLLFATAHLERGVVWNLVILSFCLGYIYRKTNSLWYSFIFHIVINGLAMGIILLI